VQLANRQLVYCAQNGKVGHQEVHQFVIFSLDLQNPASQAAVLHGATSANDRFVAPVTVT
jgi:hypothetical protein